MRISIITPSYRQLDWLRLCAASIRDQEIDPAYCEVEHIIQDGGSEGFEEVADDIRQKLYSRDFRPLDHSVRSLRTFQETDVGMYDAINRAIQHSDGEIIAWLNCDEQYLPGTLQYVARRFEKQADLDVLLGDAILADSSHRLLNYRRIIKPNRWHTRLAHLHSLSCAMFFRRRALPNPPLDPRWKVISDAILMDFFLGAGKHIEACGVPLSVYAFTGSNLSLNGADDEHGEWWKETNFPPKYLKHPVSFHHRLRRLMAGSYRIFPVSCGVVTFDSYPIRVTKTGNLSGRWFKPAP